MEGATQLDQAYWTNRYLQGKTGWDIGEVSTPLKEYIDQLEDKSRKILIPGAGNAYEAEYLWSQGFEQVHVVDLSGEPLRHLKNRVPDFPSENLLQKDFFELEGTYDLILEQTFFCALQPQLRPAYVSKMNELLSAQGKLVGLLFNIPLNDDQPPFGGSKKEYERLFQDQFDIRLMETAYNSIPPRAGNELFIQMKRKISNE